MELATMDDVLRDDLPPRVPAESDEEEEEEVSVKEHDVEFNVEKELAERKLINLFLLSVVGLIRTVGFINMLILPNEWR